MHLYSSIVKLQIDSIKVKKKKKKRGLRFQMISITFQCNSHIVASKGKAGGDEYALTLGCCFFNNEYFSLKNTFPRRCFSLSLTLSFIHFLPLLF